MNRHLARGPLDGLAGTCIGVQRPAIALQRRIHGRHLLDGTTERDQRCLDGHCGQIADTMLGNDLARDIESVGFDAETSHRFVGLVRVEKERKDLGSFADANRQDAAGEGIQRSTVADLFAPLAKQRPHPLDHRERARTARLVDDEQTQSGFFWLVSTLASSLAASRAWPTWRRSSSM